MNSDFESRFKFKVVDVIVVLLLFAFSFFCFRDTLNCDFVCDDYINLNHAHNLRNTGIFTLISSHFFECLEELTPYQLAYRPLAILWFVGVYKLLGVNVFFYHLVNIILHSSIGILIYLTLKQLVAEFSKHSARLTASLAALFFVAHPLHVEVVNWVTEQIELLCAVFYLGSIFCFISFSKSSSRRLVLFSVAMILALMSMLCKEHGVTIPLVASIYLTIFGAQQGFFKRLKESVKQTWPLWLVLGIYFVLRIIALKTPIGGYYGVLEEGWENILWKWQNGHGLDIIALPLNRELIPFPHWLYTSYFVLYLATALCWIFGKSKTESPDSLRKQIQLMAFLTLWMCICLLPPLVRWMIEPTLAGTRHIYVSSIPALMIFASLMINPAALEPPKHKNKKFYLQSGFMLQLFLSTCFLALFTASIEVNNRAWLKANDLLSELKNKAVGALEKQSNSEKLVILSVPHSWYGVHLFYHWVHMKDMFMPPFMTSDLSAKLDAPTKYLFLDEDTVRIQRLRRLDRPGNRYLYWDEISKQFRFVKLNLPEIRFLDVELKCIDPENKKANRFNFECEPELLEKADFLEVNLKCNKIPGVKVEPAPFYALTLNWESRRDSLDSWINPFYLEMFVDGKWHSYRFPVSEKKSWLFSEKTGKLNIESTDKLAYELGRVRLIDDSKLVPNFDFSGNNSQTIDSYTVNKSSGCAVSYDASKIEDAADVLLEVTKPNYFFLTRETNLRSAPGSEANVGKKIFLRNLKGTFDIPYKTFDQPGTFQLRVSARTRKNMMVGYFSDPINIEVSSVQELPSHY